MPSWWDWNACGAIGQWLAAIATFLAVLVALRAEWRTRATDIAVRVVMGATGAKMKGGPAFLISAVNHSIRSVVLDGGEIRLPDGKRLGPIPTEVFKGEIQVLERKEYAMPCETVANWLINVGVIVPTKLRFYINDTTGKQHRSVHRFDPSPWLKKP